MSRAVLHDPVNYVKRPPYGESKPSGQVFGTILGCPDNQYLDERFTAAVKIGAFLGFNYGLFGTVLKEQPALYARDKFMYYTVRCGQNALKGGVMGAMYALAVTGSCKLRGDKDDPWNHFWGGFGITAAKLVKGDWHGFAVYGVVLGVAAAALKSLYMNNFEFVRQADAPHLLTNCRYPELYLFRARAPPENLK